MPKPTARPSRTFTRLAFAAIFTGASFTALATFQSLPGNTAEDPGVTLGSGTAGLSGTVIAAQDSLFNLSTDFRGILRSMVVDTGLGYDFYYQIVNTGTDSGFGAEIFRMKSLGGFDSLPLQVTFSTDFTNLDFASFSNGPAGGAGAYTVGTKSIYSADRDTGSAGSVGFDFSPSHFLFDSANINPGEASRFGVLRTNLRTFTAINFDVSGNDTARIASLAPVPEPQAIAIFTLGAAVLFQGRPRRR